MIAASMHSQHHLAKGAISEFPAGAGEAQLNRGKDQLGLPERLARQAPAINAAL